MIEKIELQAETPTTAAKPWDPHANAVAYNRANYASQTADGEFVDDIAQEVAERVDRLAASQDQA